jgi:hypothetical protein
MPNAAAASATPNAAAITGAVSGDTAQTGEPRNAAPTTEPTPEQWEHLFAIRARLSPREAAIAENVISRMAPEMRAQWLAELSVVSIDQAVDFVRSMIPKSRAAKNVKSDDKNGGD